jgi:hypothetical protein
MKEVQEFCQQRENPSECFVYCVYLQFTHSAYKHYHLFFMCLSEPTCCIHVAENGLLYIG